MRTDQTRGCVVQRNLQPLLAARLSRKAKGIKTVPRSSARCTAASALSCMLHVPASLLTKHMDAMQMRPESSWSATRRNRLRFPLILEVNSPDADTSLVEFSRALRGTRTRSKNNLPLSTPFKPSL